MTNVRVLSRPLLKPRSCILYLLLVYLALATNAPPLLGNPASDGFFSPRLDSLIALVVDETITQRYDSALAHVEQIESIFPENPVGPFFHAAVLHSIMLDYEDYSKEKEFKRAVERTIALSKKLLRRDPRNAWGHFFLGGGLGYMAFYYGKQTRYVQAFQTGLESIAALERALEADSTLYDAYLGIGTYKYYRSRLARFLTWLPFVRDERAEGIRMVRLAVEKGKFARFPAINSLAWILAAEKRFDEANRLAREALAAYPSSRFFMWTVAATERLLGRWENSLEQYQRLLASFEKENRLRPYNELVIRTRMAECYFELGKWVESDEQRKLALAVPLSRKEKRRAKKYLQKLEHLSKALERRLTATGDGDVANH
jgi:tetratricopeptide (TPR) repeat protein